MSFIVPGILKTGGVVFEKLAITIRQAERIFAQLKQKKLIVRKGARKNGYWQIVKDA